MRLVRWRSSGRVITGRNFFPRRRGAPGFTMMELLLAIGLIALFATLLIGGSTHLLNDQPASADEVFWKAVAASRKNALESGKETRLSFADDRDHGRRFIVTDGTFTKEFPVVTAADLHVNLLSAQPKAGSAIVMAGEVVDLESLPFVTFYGDGTCSPFRVQVRVGVDSHTLAIDPWTCAPVLVPPDRV